MSAPPPLDKLLVVDLSQFLAGPYASLRLQDLGARVIKIENPKGGDLCRQIYFSDTKVGGESTIFHAINRGKESLALNLKTKRDAARLQKLLCRADVVIQNFRPGVIERLGFGYKAAAAINPRIVYASISGYGADGPWARLPGQDLLAQARSGAMWLSGNADDGPVPFGLAVADILAGANAAHGILAALVRRGMGGRGAHVETSLLEAMVDFQFEVLAMHLNDGGRPPRRAAAGSAHASLAPPYGVYNTKDGHIAIAMASLETLADIFGSEALHKFAKKKSAWFARRDDIKAVVADIIKNKSTAEWLSILEAKDVWCAPILSWRELLKEEAFRRLGMVQSVACTSGENLRLVRSPVRIDGDRAASSRAAPSIGEDSRRLISEFNL